MDESKFISPIYNILRVPIDQVVAQRVNPNIMDSKSFNALQMSIYNSGFTMCTTGCLNMDYDPNVEPLSYMEKLKRHIEGDDGDMRSGGSYFDYATNISDENFRKMFKYELMDGAQRTALIRLGSYHFFSTPNHDDLARRWSESIDVPKTTGKYMLMYLAWRENFTIPMSINDSKSEVQKLSITVLSNVAKGSHNFETIQDMVLRLTSLGVKKSWISSNLFIDMDSIDKIMQINGISELYHDFEEEDSWVPEEDPNYIAKQNVYMDRSALQWLMEKVRNGELNGVTDIERYAGGLNGKDN